MLMVTYTSVAHLAVADKLNRTGENLCGDGTRGPQLPVIRVCEDPAQRALTVMRARRRSEVDMHNMLDGKF